MDVARISFGGEGHSAKINLTKTFEKFKIINMKFAQNLKILQNFSEIKFMKI